MHSLTAISPVDGRYNDQLQELSQYFSEMALMKYRLMVEIKYFIALGEAEKIPELPAFSEERKIALRFLYSFFSLDDAKRVKELERTTKHDTKAIEYFLREKFYGTPFEQYASFIHFGLTSEDINNLSYSLAWNNALQYTYIPRIGALWKQLRSLAKQYQRQPLLAMTHGQPATPTTLGKEFAVYAERLLTQVRKLATHKLDGKLNGATGTWSAHHIAYPKVNWTAFSKRFIRSLGLKPKLLTTQVESYDSLVESYQTIQRINTILIDLARDMWLYTSRGIFTQEITDGEVGSSTMPHKTNPINFENAEGNCGMANALFAHLVTILPVSRMQRDLSGSTAIRNQGVALAHSLLACKNILHGLQKITVNQDAINRELNSHWEVLGEAIQTMLRKYGKEDAYEKIKRALQGRHIAQYKIHEIISETDLPQEAKEKLFSLTPRTYTGLASQLSSI